MHRKQRLKPECTRILFFFSSILRLIVATSFCFSSFTTQNVWIGKRDIKTLCVYGTHKMRHTQKSRGEKFATRVDFCTKHKPSFFILSLHLCWRFSATKEGIYVLLPASSMHFFWAEEKKKKKCAQLAQWEAHIRWQLLRQTSRRDKEHFFLHSSLHWTFVIQNRSYPFFFPNQSLNKCKTV